MDGRASESEEHAMGERIAAARAELARAADADARLAILVRTVEETPELSEIRWLLYQHYVGIGEHEAARRQLTLGLARGEREFVLEQARRFPASLDGAAFERIASESPVLAAGCELALGRVEEAKKRLMRVVEESGAAYRGAPLPRDLWIDVISIAIEHDAFELARWMLDVLSAGRVRFEGTDTGRADAEHAAAQTCLRELVELPSHVPRAHRAALARALRATTPEASDEAIYAVRRDGHDDGAQVFRDLKATAPALAARFRRPLVGKVPSAEQQRAPHASTMSFGWALLAILVVLVAFNRAC